MVAGVNEDVRGGLTHIHEHVKGFKEGFCQGEQTKWPVEQYHRFSSDNPH